MTYELPNNKYVRCLNCNKIFIENGPIHQGQHSRCDVEPIGAHVQRTMQECRELLA